MEFLYFMLFFGSLYLVLKFFAQKLMVLLMMELSFLSLVMFYLFFSYSLGSCNTFFSGFIFLIIMVLDSVFGLCLLIFTVRNSSRYSNFVV